MGKEFYDTSPEAKAIFDEAENILGNDLKKTIFEGPQEKLTLTAYCQPAIVAFSIAALKAFQAHPKYRNITPKFTAGLSLGEYSALVASGVFSFKEAISLVERRSFFMEEATQKEPGKMAAVIGFDKEKLIEICKETGAQVANFNAPTQIVITGHAQKVEAASKKIAEDGLPAGRQGAKSVIPLDVSGAFHSTLMEPAARQFEEILKGREIKPPVITPMSNVTGLPHGDIESIRKNLVLQITSSVRWVNIVEYIAQQGVVDFIESGPGTVLRGLIRKTNRDLKVHNIQTPGDIEGLPF